MFTASTSLAHTIATADAKWWLWMGDCGVYIEAVPRMRIVCMMIST